MNKISEPEFGLSLFMFSSSEPELELGESVIYLSGPEPQFEMTGSGVGDCFGVKTESTPCSGNVKADSRHSHGL